jgi:hypothetical protein
MSAKKQYQTQFEQMIERTYNWNHVRLPLLVQLVLGLSEEWLGGVRV